jgi:hypothetical protein
MRLPPNSPWAEPAEALTHCYNSLPDLEVSERFPWIPTPSTPSVELVTVAIQGSVNDEAHRDANWKRSGQATGLFPAGAIINHSCEPNVEMQVGDISQYQTEISQYQTDMSQYQTEIAQSQTDISQYQTDMSQYQTEISQSQTEISQSQTDMSRSQTDMSQSQTDISQSQTDISQYQTDISQYQTERAFPDTGLFQTPLPVGRTHAVYAWRT